jgi:hypothetical protein
LKSDEEKKQEKAHADPSKPVEKPVDEIKKDPKSSEKDKEKEGIDNMAFLKTKGDDEEEKAMNPIFQSFNNFTSKFKFTSDKIENVEPEVEPKDVVDSSAEKVVKDSGENSISSKDDIGSQENASEEQKSIESNENIENSNDDKEEKDDSPSNSERAPSVPEVTTIITAPEPSEPEKKTKEHRKGTTDDTFSKRNTDNVLFFEGATLSSPDLELKRRHSTDVVSAARPANEELIQEDMKKRGIPFKRKSTKKLPQGTRGTVYNFLHNILVVNDM